MKFLIVSDTHGNRSSLETLLSSEKFDGFLHLGDGAREAAEVSGLFPGLIFLGVTGNCDFDTAGLPAERIASVGGVPSILCHGHRYGVKLGYGTLISHARALGVRAVFCGHTHIPVIREYRGILLVNPGSLGFSGSYAVAETEDGKIKAELFRL